MLDFDVYSLIRFVLNSTAIIFGFLFVFKKTASKYLAVDGSFDFHHQMSIGGDGGGDRGAAVCAGCGRLGTKTCSRCKKVRYCSQACQSKHWEAEHKLKCKQMGCPDRLGGVPSADGAYCRRKSSGFDPVSLVPARGSSKVLQEPKKFLFPYKEFIKLFNWDNPGFPPCGLINSGNSCFANVVLQCLACTRPLTAYLLERDHCRTCIRKQENWCFLCELQAHVKRASQSRQPFSPINILSRIPNIGGNLGCESQEDAHEFMRFTIDTMQSVCLDEHGGEKALDLSTQETTLIQHIFGGHLLSQVKCTKCKMISNRYENMMDLTVEIHGDAESLEECLEQFTARECLDGDNMYKCDGCNGYVKAWKRLTIHQAPNILTIALKRFQSGIFGKLNKRVTFPEELDLSPYMSEGGDGTDLYSLYAVVVHVDMLNASFFGHYICYTKDYYGRWYKIDDCQVANVDVEEVLSQGAYMLLYSRRTARKQPFVKPIEPQLTSGGSDSSNIPISANVSNGLINLHSNIGSESNSSLLRDKRHGRLAEIESDTIEEYCDMELEVDPMLVHKDLEDVDIKDSGLSLMEPKGCGEEQEVSSTQHSHIPENAASDVQDMDCEETFNFSNSNSQIEDDIAMPSDASITSSSSTVPASADTSKFKPENCLLCSSFGITKSSPTLQSGSIGKSKLLLPRGFLDKLSEEKFVDYGKRTLTQKVKVEQKVLSNGDNAATLEATSERTNGSTPDSNMAFISRGFLNRSYRKSVAQQKTGQMGSEAACSSESSSTSADITSKIGKLGSEACSSTSTQITPKIGQTDSEAAYSRENSSTSTKITKIGQTGSEAVCSNENSSNSTDTTVFCDKESGCSVSPNDSMSLDVDKNSSGRFDGQPKQMNGVCSQSCTGE